MNYMFQQTSIEAQEQKLEEAVEALKGDSIGPSLLETLRFLSPRGFRPIVQLQDKGRKKRKNASLDSWSPETGEILIFFEAAGSDRPRADDTATRSDPVEELIRALSEAEASPTHSFVALKWFRDTFLVAKVFSWAASVEQRHSVLEKAIADGLILTSKVPNPRQPNYPTTAIRLNRQHNRVRRELAPSSSRFRPVPITGEPLSSTLLRDRGEY